MSSGNKPNATENPLRSLFLLDPNIVFLNHGSFGACPKPVIEVYQEWQRRLEHQPVAFLGRELNFLYRIARQALGNYLKSDADDLVFVPNATHGVNIVARSLELKPDDEILSTDHEYGACDNIWRYICQKSGARYIRQTISLPISYPEELIEQLWAGVNPHTRLIFISHITSPTAQRFPVELICQRARQSGILTLIDGAHAPGQIPLDLPGIGADFYTGNCHKWMMSPKGAGFLYAQREVQNLIEPLVISWGLSADESTTTGSRYIDLLQWTGTHDPAAVLSVPAAIQFLQEYNWDLVRQKCPLLLKTALNRIGELTGLPPIYPENESILPDPLPPQMAIAPLPRIADLIRIKSQLYEEHHIEAPLIEWNDRQFMRISVQGYNTGEDIDLLLKAMEHTIYP